MFKCLVFSFLFFIAFSGAWTHTCYFVSTHPHLPDPSYHLSLRQVGKPSPGRVLVISLTSLPGPEHAHPCFCRVAVMLHTSFCIFFFRLTPYRKHYSITWDTSFVVTFLNDKCLGWLARIYSSLPSQLKHLFILCSILCCVEYPHSYDNFSRNKCVLIDFNRFLICYGFSFFDASIFSECAFSFLYFLWLKYIKYYPVESLDLFHCYFFYCFKPWKVLPGSWLIVPKLWCNLGSLFFWWFCGFKKIYLTL